MTTSVRYRKVCRCSGPAETNHFHIRYSQTRAGESITIHFNPAPTCVKCGKAWRKINPNKTNP